MLNKDTLGQALYDFAKSYNDKAPDEIGDIEAARLAFWKGIADEVIKHLKNNIVLKIPGTGLVAGANAVTGLSITGQIE